MDRLTGIHAVREALEANRPLDSLMVARGTHGNRIEELVRLARQHSVPVRFEERIQLDRAAGTREHQGVIGQNRGKIWVVAGYPQIFATVYRCDGSGAAGVATEGG